MFMMEKHLQQEELMLEFIDDKVEQQQVEVD